MWLSVWVHGHCLLQLYLNGWMWRRLQVDVTLHDVDTIDRECLASVYGIAAIPKQPELLQLQALLHKSKTFLALVDGPDRVGFLTISTI